MTLTTASALPRHGRNSTRPRPPDVIIVVSAMTVNLIGG
jgi:hypothetical protein